MLNRKNYIKLLLMLVVPAIFISAPHAYAVTTPDLGEATSFSILSSTYTNTSIGTTINGDLGYTTGPAMAPTVNGIIYSPPSSKYSTAGTDQAAVLSVLNSSPCNFNFGSATDLSSLSQPLAPGVYCVTGATSIGTGGITLSGSGTYIFRIDGALNTVANSAVRLTGGAETCDVFWTPNAATTLGANSVFAGTVIDAAGITIGSTVTWTGRGLAFGGTVSTDADAITRPTCNSDSEGTPNSTPTSALTVTPISISQSPPPQSTPTTVPVSSSSSTDTSGSGGSSSRGQTTVCPALNYNTPIIIESRRVNANSIFISWGPYSGIDTFNIRYGLENGSWLYNTNVTGFSTTINSLPANQLIWIQVATRNTCSIGTYGEPKLIGGSARGNSIGFPNTGNSQVPKLPNTGNGPQKNNVGLSILIMTLLVSTLVSLTKITDQERSKN